MKSLYQSSALGGEETEQDKNKEKKKGDADEERKIITLPTHMVLKLLSNFFWTSKHPKMHICRSEKSKFSRGNPEPP